MAKLALLPPAVGEAFKTYVDVNFRRIEDFINNFIDTGVPAGTVIQAHRDDDLTPDYVEANGQAVSRTEYPDLHALAQAKSYASGWGAGDGSTTFNVPNLNGRYIKQGILGSKGGASSHQHANYCSTDGVHDHGGSTNDTSESWSELDNSGPFLVAKVSHNHTINAHTGHNHEIINQTANNEPPWAALRYYIKT